MPKEIIANQMQKKASDALEREDPGMKGHRGRFRSCGAVHRGPIFFVGTVKEPGVKKHRKRRPTARSSPERLWGLRRRIWMGRRKVPSGPRIMGVQTCIAGRG